MLMMVNSIRIPLPYITYRLRHIFAYTGRVIGDFVLYFVAIATGVGRGRIFPASFNSTTPKTPYYT